MFVIIIIIVTGYCYIRLVLYCNNAHHRHLTHVLRTTVNGQCTLIRIFVQDMCVELHNGRLEKRYGVAKVPFVQFVLKDKVILQHCKLHHLNHVLI